jgi:hypothetical protein
MRDLAQLQRWMQTVVMHPGGAIEGMASAEARQVIDVRLEDVEQVVRPSRALSGLERLEIYNRGYYARLVECLRDEFPVLKHALGDEAFDQFAVAYLRECPSRSYTLNQLGASFPRYLAESRPGAAGAGASWPDFLIDLATLELTYNEVFDGPGVEGQPLLNADLLQAIAPDRWTEARIVPVCCLRLLSLRYPAHKYFAGVRKKRDPRFPSPADTFLAVTRRRYIVRRYELCCSQFILLSALAAGQPVGQAIGAMAEAANADMDELAAKLNQWFYNWTAEGLFQGIALPAATADS